MENYKLFQNKIICIYIITFCCLDGLIAQSSEHIRLRDIDIEISGPDQSFLNNAASNIHDWLYATHDYSGQRFVEVSKIHTGNVHEIVPICAFQAGDQGAFHTNPIVYNGIMFLTTRYDIIAIDAQTCREYWRRSWDRKREVFMQSNRGAAIKDGKLIWGTGDGQLIAVDAATGDLLWSHYHANLEKGEKFNMPPLLFEDLVVIGIAGSESGINGWIAAFDLETGNLIWRFDIIPDEDDPASETWGHLDALKQAGGAVWTPITLDMETEQLYIGTANPAPAFDGRGRPGDNLYTNSLIVLDIRTGNLIWYKQLVSHDVHDRGVTSPGPLYETSVNGVERFLVATAGKDGILRVLDRKSQDILFETQVTTQLNGNKEPDESGIRICPGLLGGVQWNGPSYHRDTNSLIVPSVDWCTTYIRSEDPDVMLSKFMGGAFEFDPVEESGGWLHAVDGSTGEIKWRYESDAPMVAAVTTTSGGLVLTGEVSGDFLVLDAENGEVLYRFYTGGAMNGGILTYQLEADDKQYIAATSGGMTSFWQKLGGSSTVFIFGLPQ